MDSSIVFFVVVLSTVSGQIRLLCLQETCLHCFSVDSSTVAYKAWLYGCYKFLCLDLFWHKKEAAASTVCLTGFPCHFFWFFPMTGFLLIFLFSL